MMKKFLYILTVVAIALFAVSCEEDNGAYEPVPNDFSVTLSTTTVTAAGGDITAMISAGNLGWWVESDVTWCTSSKYYGSGDAEITLKVKANTTGSSRTGIVTISPTMDQTPIEFTIIQD